MHAGDGTPAMFTGRGGEPTGGGHRGERERGGRGAKLSSWPRFGGRRHGCPRTRARGRCGGNLRSLPSYVRRRHGHACARGGRGAKRSSWPRSGGRRHGRARAHGRGGKLSSLRSYSRRRHGRVRARGGRRGKCSSWLFQDICGESLIHDEERWQSGNGSR